MPSPIGRAAEAPTKTTMRAIVQERFGGPEVLELREVDVPILEDDRVLVQVRAASINPYDWHMIRGLPYMVRITAGLRVPKNPIPGVDFAGVVVAVGKDVTEFRPGDEVFGSGIGAYAEYAAVRERSIVLKPENITFVQGASGVIAALTALQGLRDRGNLKAGQKVLINGASGGVGTFAVQIARSIGAEVTGVCSTRNVKTVRSIGADHVVDYTKENFTESGEEYDLIFDVVSTQSMSSIRKVLADDGVYVNAGAVKMGNWVGPFSHVGRVALGSITGSQKMVGMLSQTTKEHLNDIRDYLASGEVVPAIDKSYPLAEVGDAMVYMETMHARGKVVITI